MTRGNTLKRGSKSCELVRRHPCRRRFGPFDLAEPGVTLLTQQGELRHEPAEQLLAATLALAKSTDLIRRRRQ